MRLKPVQGLASTELCRLLLVDQAKPIPWDPARRHERQRTQLEISRPRYIGTTLLHVHQHARVGHVKCSKNGERVVVAILAINHPLQALFLQVDQVPGRRVSGETIHCRRGLAERYRQAAELFRHLLRLLVSHSGNTFLEELHGLPGGKAAQVDHFPKRSARMVRCHYHP